jgi:vitamin K-dependent gamma-carboxylase
MANRLFRPLDIAPLVFFRIAAGVLIAVECAGHALTRFSEPYVQATFHFSWPLTPWLTPGPPPTVYAHMMLNCAAAALVALGLFYRATAVVLCVGLGLLLAMEQTAYINHTYLYSLLAGILACIPAHGAVSLDARRRPGLLRAAAPAWCLYLLRFQIAVVYVFAGIAKIDADWLRAMPISFWLSTRPLDPVFGEPLARLLATAPTAYVISYAGLIFDLLIVPAMLWSRTRVAAFAVAIVFHLGNVVMFGIGTFPWLSIAATALFFPPEQFRRLPWLRHRLERDRAAVRDAGSVSRLPPSSQRLVASALALYAAVQIAIPARSLLVGGYPSWTEIGHTFAWRMMLRSKIGSVRFIVTDSASGETWTERPVQYLTPRQVTVFAGDPEMILQLAAHVRRVHAAAGRDVEVRADAFARLNGRPPRRLLRREVNLAPKEGRLGTLDVVVPFERNEERGSRAGVGR